MKASRQPSKALVAKRERIVRSLHAHIQWLEVCATLAPWPNITRAWDGRPKQTWEEWEAYWERHAPAQYVSPREKPGLHRRYDGLAEVTEAQVAAYVATHPELNPAAAPATVRSLVFLKSFGKR